jgi:hypothetical protein
MATSSAEIQQPYKSPVLLVAALPPLPPTVMRWLLVGEAGTKRTFSARIPARLRTFHATVYDPDSQVAHR